MHLPNKETALVIDRFYTERKCTVVFGMKVYRKRYMDLPEFVCVTNATDTFTRQSESEPVLLD
jgi:hypothetical protein